MLINQNVQINSHNQFFLYLLLCVMNTCRCLWHLWYVGILTCMYFLLVFYEILTWYFLDLTFDMFISLHIFRTIYFHSKAISKAITKLRSHIICLSWLLFFSRSEPEYAYGSGMLTKKETCIIIIIKKINSIRMSKSSLLTNQIQTNTQIINKYKEGIFSLVLYLSQLYFFFATSAVNVFYWPVICTVESICPKPN